MAGPDLLRPDPTTGVAIVIMGVSGCGKSNFSNQSSPLTLTACSHNTEEENMPKWGAAAALCSALMRILCRRTVAAMLADALGCGFVEADDYHSHANKAKMSKGVPLTDEDRIPWLESLRDAIWDRLGRREDVAVSCSALRLKYREILRQGDRNYKAGSYGTCRVKFACLEASAEVIAERVARRAAEGGHFMPASLVRCQLDLLEIDAAEGITVVDATVNAHAIVQAAVAQFRDEHQ